MAYPAMVERLLRRTFVEFTSVASSESDYAAAAWVLPAGVIKTEELTESAGTRRSTALVVTVGRAWGSSSVLDSPPRVKVCKGRPFARAYTTGR